MAGSCSWYVQLMISVPHWMINNEPDPLVCRCGGVAWGSDDLALLYESGWKTRTSKIWAMRPGQPSEEKQILFDRCNPPSGSVLRAAQIRMV